MTAEAPADRLLVSVIVAVYGPGAELELCLESITRQSLDRAAYELIIVDDGSAPDTAARVAAFGGLLPHTVVLHEPHAGWAGPLRDAGVRAAGADFVIFVDPDGRLNPESLERLYGTGRRNGADLVLGKHGGTLADPDTLFAANRDRCSLRDAPLLSCRTVHQLFRRSFLLRHDLGFGTEAGPLADDRFMITAYLRAATVSIIADYVCYLWIRRDDDSLSSLLDPTPVGASFDAIGALLRLVVDQTEAGELRDQTLARLFGTEVMSRLREPGILRLSPADLAETTTRAQALAAEFVEPTAGVLDALPTITRLQTRLLLTDASASLLLLARRQHGDVRARPAVTRRQFDKGVLELVVSCELLHRDGSPVTLRRRDGRFLLDPSLTAGLVGLDPEGWPVGDPLDGADLRVLLRDEPEQTAWFPPAQLHPSLVHLADDRYTIVLSAQTRIDPRRLGSGLAAGTYAVGGSARILGYTFRTELTVRTGPFEIDVDERSQVVDPTPHSFPAPLRAARAVAERLLPDAVTRLAMRGARAALRRARSLR